MDKSKFPNLPSSLAFSISSMFAALIFLESFSIIVESQTFTMVVFIEFPVSPSIPPPLIATRTITFVLPSGKFSKSTLDTCGCDVFAPVYLISHTPELFQSLPYKYPKIKY